MKKTITITIISLTFFSCSKIIGRMLGIKPKVESKKEQLNYLNNNEINTSNTYNFNIAMEDSMSSMKYNIDTFPENEFSPIQFRMYNNQGDFVGGWASCFGSLKRMQALDSFPLNYSRVKHLPLNYNLNFKRDINLIDSNSQLNLEYIKDYDLTIIAFWAESMGKFSNDMMINLNNYVKKNSDRKILFIKVNFSNLFKN